MKDDGLCEHCGKHFRYAIYHAGFGEMAFAYCDRCGGACLLDRWRWPRDVPYSQGTISREVEPHLRSCRCGGSFRADASPRCPHCDAELSAEAASKYIEANAPGTAKGWRWQRSWKGYYVISVEGRETRDPWQTPV